MDLDPVLLARLQFAFTVTFHIIFPSFTIGLSVAPHRVFLSVKARPDLNFARL
jgi:cytochrome bd-type quinol oxidase subunit 1